MRFELYFLILFSGLVTVNTNPENEVTLKKPKYLFWKLNSPRTSSSTLMEIGNQLVDLERYDEALKFYNKAIIERKHTEASYLNHRAICYLKMKKFDLAYTEFKDAVDNEKVSNILSDVQFSNLGNALSHEGKYSEAIWCYSRAIERDTRSDPYYLFQRGSCYKQINDFDNAISDFKNAALRRPQNLDIQKLLSECLYKSNEFDQVVKNALMALNDSELELLANKWRYEREYVKAIFCYTVVIDRYPLKNFTLLRYARGKCYADLRIWEDAITDFKFVVKMNPEKVEDRRTLIDLLFFAGKVEGAKQETNALNYVNLKKLASEYYAAERQMDAIHVLDAAIERYPTDRDLYQMRKVYSATIENQANMAISDQSMVTFDLYKAIRMDPENKVNRENLCRELSNCDKFDETVKAMLAVLDVNNLLVLGNKMKDKNKLTEAIYCYEEGLKKDSTNVDLYHARGKCLQEMQQTELAISDLETGLLIDPDNRDSRRILFEILISAEKYDEAIEKTHDLLDIELVLLALDLCTADGNNFVFRLFDEAINRNPSEASVYKLRGDCHLKKKNVDSAISDLKEAIRLSPDITYFRMHLSDVFFNIGRYNEAIQEIVKTNSNQIKVFGQKFLDHDKFDGAIFLFSEAMKRNPNHTECYAKRGFCYWKLGKLDDAISDLKMSLKHFPLPSNTLDAIHLCEVYIDAEKFDDAQKILDDISTYVRNAEIIAKVCDLRGRLNSKRQERRDQE